MVRAQYHSASIQSAREDSGAELGGRKCWIRFQAVSPAQKHSRSEESRFKQSRPGNLRSTYSRSEYNTTAFYFCDEGILCVGQQRADNSPWVQTIHTFCSRYEFRTMPFLIVEKGSIPINLTQKPIRGFVVLIFSGLTLTRSHNPKRILDE